MCLHIICSGNLVVVVVVVVIVVVENRYIHLNKSLARGINCYVFWVSMFTNANKV